MNMNSKIENGQVKTSDVKNKPKYLSSAVWIVVTLTTVILMVPFAS